MRFVGEGATDVGGPYRESLSDAVGALFLPSHAPPAAATLAVTLASPATPAAPATAPAAATAAAATAATAALLNPPPAPLASPAASLGCGGALFLPCANARADAGGFVDGLAGPFFIG